MHIKNRDHAIVIGASVGGLATAAALAPRFRRVTIFERHAAPRGILSIAPQGRYPHVMLEGGANALERLLPGVTAALSAAGAPAVDRDHVRWWADGWRARRATAGSPRVLATRALLESTLRERVAALPNVEIQYGTTTKGLVIEHDRVLGIHTAAGSSNADLVIDAGGRSSHAATWLVASGYPAPPVTEIEVDLGYLVVTLRRRPTDFGGQLACVVQNLAPETTRLGLAIAVEDDRWMVLLGGYFGDLPPVQRDGQIAFARSLPVTEIADLLESSEPIGTALPYRFRSSRRVHLERVARLSAGFVVLGDALCSFNPLYGQGMSVALMQAEQLGSAVERGRLATVQRELARIADAAWTIAAGGDLAYPRVQGKRTRFGRFMSRYMRELFRACTVDGRLVDTLWNVTNLVAPPSALLHPATVLRVVWAKRRAGAKAAPMPQLVARTE
jgi:2-polyprenyl-6-methoxyphenol hydroxylase-like FAD-dependent oxidoreductase